MINQQERASQAGKSMCKGQGVGRVVCLVRKPCHVSVAGEGGSTAGREAERPETGGGAGRGAAGEAMIR